MASYWERKTNSYTKPPSRTYQKREVMTPELLERVQLMVIDRVPRAEIVRTLNVKYKDIPPPALSRSEVGYLIKHVYGYGVDKK